jgi:Na+/proline symporter
VVLGIVVVFLTVLTNVDISIADAVREASAAGRLRIMNFSTDPSELTSFWACVIGGAVLCMAPLTTDQAILQRLFTTKSEKDCRQAIILQSFIIVPITLMLNTVGVALYVFYQHHPERLAGLSNPDAILPFFAVRELPSGVSGFIVASIFAASMAVMSAGINALTTATTVDFYQRLWRPNCTPEHYAVVGRAGTVMWGAIVTFAALFAHRLGELATAYSFASSIISGPLLGIFLLATLSTRATSIGVLAGAAAGGVAVACASSFTHWSFFYLGPIGLLATLLAGSAVSLFTAPPDRAHIRGYVRGHE